MGAIGRSRSKTGRASRTLAKSKDSKDGVRNPFHPSFGVSPPLLGFRDKLTDDFVEALLDGPGSAGRDAKQLMRPGYGPAGNGRAGCEAQMTWRQWGVSQ